MSIFRTREYAADDLALGLDEPRFEGALFVGSTWGAIEIGYPFAILNGGELALVRPNELIDRGFPLVKDR